MPHLAIIGKSFKPLERYLDQRNQDWLLLSYKASDAKRTDTTVTVDINDPQVVSNMLSEKGITLSGLLCVYEDYVKTTANLAEALSLSGMPIESAKACTDKTIMRALFSKVPGISPEFSQVASEDELIEFAKSHSFPLILKPANLSKSLLVTKSHDLDELLANYSKAIESIESLYAKYATNSTPKLMVEEFLEGSVHSIDAFVDYLGTPHLIDEIVDYETGYDIGYDDNFHYSRIIPSQLGQEQQAALKDCAVKGMQALGMRSSPAHVEIIMTKDGPRIVEIGARNGGYRERMHRMANGIDIYGCALSLAAGEIPDTTPTKREPCGVFELFPKTSGNFSGLSNLDELKDLASLTYLSIKAKPGQPIGKSSEGHKAAAVVILQNKDLEIFNRDVTYLREHVSIEVT